jgi:apolipoprotein D and lipocalin family protein
MHRLSLLAGLALVACVPDAPAGYRDPGVAISSAGAFVPGRFVGEWDLVAAYGDDAACGPLRETWTVEAGRYAVRGSRCGPAGPVAFATMAALTGPGRITRFGPAGPEDYWILWIDADYRVAAIGAPDGARGRIITRPGAARPDLISAAKDVLAFNGYDLISLRWVSAGP